MTEVERGQRAQMTVQTVPRARLEIRLEPGTARRLKGISRFYE